MMLIDANVLLYAYDAGAAQHAVAKAFWERSLSEPAPVRLAWATIIAFLRMGTHQRVFTHPLTSAEARGHVSEWLSRPMVDVLEPSTRHWDILSDLLDRSQAAGNLVTDAHLAALAIEHGATLMTTDQDFVRFPGLSWRNPLA